MSIKQEIAEINAQAERAKEAKEGLLYEQMKMRTIRGLDDYLEIYPNNSREMLLKIMGLAEIAGGMKSIEESMKTLRRTS